MAYKMKGWSGYQNSPMKHDLPGGEDHVHDSSFDVDTDESDFSKDDKRIYVKNKKEKVKKEKKVKEKKPKKDTMFNDVNNDGTVVSRGAKKFGKWISRIRIKGGGRSRTSSGW